MIPPCRFGNDGEVYICTASQSLEVANKGQIENRVSNRCEFSLVFR